mgnify:CR=1 FL=1
MGIVACGMRPHFFEWTPFVDDAFLIDHKVIADVTEVAFLDVPLRNMTSY